MGIVVDAHSDLINDIHPRRLRGETKVLQNHWLPGMLRGGIDLRVAAIYLQSRYLPELALRQALDMTATIHEELDQTPEACLCTTGDDIRTVREQGRVGFILGLEGAEPLGTDLQLLRIFHTLGLRVLGLTHARRNQAADGAPLLAGAGGQSSGLTGFGADLVKKAEELGILIDVSHLNEPGFWDVIEISTAPVIASHSNCRALLDHPRNLTDDQIRAVADSGGVVGVNACAIFVRPDGTLADLLDHVDHLCGVAGPEHVGLGVDFCDYLRPYISPEELAKLPPDGGFPVAGLAGDEDFSKLTGELSSRGYRPEEVELIMGENFVRVFESVFRD